MNKPRFNWTRFPELCEEPPELVVVYEDFETWFRVRDELRALWGHYDAGRSPRTAAWNFSLFEHPDFLNMAVRDADGAAAIIISAHGNTALPPSVETLIERWRDSSISPASMVVILLDAVSQNHPAGNQIVDYIEHFALIGHLDWSVRFCDVKQQPGPGWLLHILQS